MAEAVFGNALGTAARRSQSRPSAAFSPSAPIPCTGRLSRSRKSSGSTRCRQPTSVRVSATITCAVRRCHARIPGSVAQNRCRARVAYSSARRCHLRCRVEPYRLRIWNASSRRLRFGITSASALSSPISPTPSLRWHCTPSMAGGAHQPLQS